MRESLRSFWQVAAVGHDRLGSERKPYVIGRERCRPEPLLSIWAAGRVSPITEVLVAEGLNVYAVDAAPSFVHAFQRNFPNIPVACEAVERSTFFDLTFDGAVAWGLIFLLSPEEQRRLLERIAGILAPAGRLLFTSCAEPLVWSDAMTGLESRSLGAEEYRGQLLAVGLAVANEYDDEGRNHYFDAFKARALNSDPAMRR